MWPALLQAALESVALAVLAAVLQAREQASLLALFGVARLPIRAAQGLYRPHHYHTLRDDRWTGTLCEGAALGLATVLFVLLFRVSPTIHAGFWVLWPAALYALTRAYRRGLRQLHLRWVNVLRTLVVGDGRAARRFVRWHDQHLGLGYRVAGLVRTRPGEIGDRYGYDIVATLDDDLAAVAARLEIDAVVVAVPRQDERRVRQALARLAGYALFSGTELIESVPRRRQSGPNKRRAHTRSKRGKQRQAAAPQRT